MTPLFCCCSLRTGCIVGAVIFLVIVIFKIVMITIITFSQGFLTVVLLNIILLLLAGILLLVGVIKEERISMITFICFTICAIATEALGFLCLYAFDMLRDDEVPITFLIFLILAYIPIVYMIPVGILEYRVIKENHLRLTLHMTSRTGAIHTSAHPAGLS